MPDAEKPVADKPDALALPPAEALRYWQSRVPMTKAEYEAAGAEAKQRAVYVGGLAKADLVREVFESMHQSMADGTTFEAWKRDIGPRLQKAGWTGASPHRLETIYRTNVQSAYMAGRYAQMQRAVKLRPYWQYSAVNDSRTRPAHRALHGKVYPADHAFWGTLYPPNGFRCRCTVKSLSERQVRARGLEIETEIPTSLDEAAHGIPGLGTVAIAPDKGFSGNVGKDWWAGLAPEQVATPAPGTGSPRLLCPGKGFAEEGPSCWISTRDIAGRHVLPVAKGDLLPAGLSQAEYIKAFLAEFGVPFGGSKAIRLAHVEHPLVVNDRLFLDKASGTYKVAKEGRERYVRLLARTILNPFEIWQYPTRLGDRMVQTLNLIRLFAGEDGKIGGFGVFRLYGGRQWSGSTVFPPKVLGREQDMLRYLDEQRRKALDATGPAALVFREP
jgi:phage putative head morphogenesis protein, SPP1 gp7 family